MFVVGLGLGWAWMGERSRFFFFSEEAGFFVVSFEIVGSLVGWFRMIP